jgi:CubicO group peptidase (beta-lactamase class C family)
MNTIAPEKVGLSSARLDRIRTHMQRYVDQKKYAGIITAIARHDKLAFAECFGMMDIEANKPMQFDTIFRIASMTKPITSVAAMMLYEEGRFQLNNPVSKFIPEFTDLKVYKNATEVMSAEREMTIRDLLTHTSGLSGGFNPQGDPVDALYQKVQVRDPGGTLKDMIAKLVELPLATDPGSEWRYSLSTTVLGYLIQVISGLSFDVFLRQRIFEPLGMMDTGFHVPPEKLDRLAALYGPADNGLRVVETPGFSKSGFTKPATFFSGEGGLVSTTSDYLRFSQMLLHNGELDGVRLLSRKTVELMTTNHLPNKLLPYRLQTVQKGLGFGLGFSVVMDIGQSGTLGSVGTYSWGGAFNTNFWIDPKEDLIGISMTQYSIPLQPIRQEFQILAYQAVID